MSINGKLGGSISFIKNSYIVRFQGYPRKTFSITTHGDLESAKEAAILYKTEISDKKGITKNKYRIINDYVECQLYGGFICKIDLRDLPILRMYTWHAKK